MATDAPSASFFSPWPDRLRHSAIILLVAGLALAVLVAFGELSLAHAAAVFACPRGRAAVPAACGVGAPALCAATAARWHRNALRAARAPPTA